MKDTFWTQVKKLNKTYFNGILGIYHSKVSKGPSNLPFVEISFIRFLDFDHLHLHGAFSCYCWVKYTLSLEISFTYFFLHSFTHWKYSCQVPVHNAKKRSNTSQQMLWLSNAQNTNESFQIRLEGQRQIPWVVRPLKRNSKKKKSD